MVREASRGRLCAVDLSPRQHSLLVLHVGALVSTSEVEFPFSFLLSWGLFLGAGCLLVLGQLLR